MSDLRLERSSFSLAISRATIRFEMSAQDGRSDGVIQNEEVSVDDRSDEMA